MVAGTSLSLDFAKVGAILALSVRTQALVLNDLINY